MDKNRVLNIFNSYKTEYDLEGLGFKERELFEYCSFHDEKFLIIFNLEELKDNLQSNREGMFYDLQNRSCLTNIEDIMIFCLIHELAHAIDLKINKTRFKSEVAEMDKDLYRSCRIYHHRQPFELRADKFAREEVKKYIGVN